MQIKRNKTFIPKQADINRQVYIIDAKRTVLGKLAVKAADVLRGKNKPTFTPHVDTGDTVVVINAANVAVTGKKLDQKIYQRYTGYPSGLREVKLKDMLSKNPELVIELAVKNMLPDNKLKAQWMKRLKVYKDENHNHGTKLKKLEV